MAWNWGVDLKSYVDASENTYFALNKIVAKAYYRYFADMLLWSMVLAFIMTFGNYVLTNYIEVKGLSLLWLMVTFVLGIFHIQNKLYQKQSHWLLWLLAIIPYVFLPFIIFQYISYLGIFLATFFVISFAYFVQEIVANDATIIDAYVNSFRLTWWYNLRFLAFLLIPWIFIIAAKHMFITALGIQYIGEFSWVLFWLVSVLALPWTALSYTLFHDYLQVEKNA